MEGDGGDEGGVGEETGSDIENEDVVQEAKTRGNNRSTMTMMYEGYRFS